MKMKLTASAIAGLTLPDGKADETCWHEDLAGFGVRMRSSGHKNFLVQYAIRGRTKRVSLGDVSEIEFSKALRLAKDLLAKIRLGGDPAHDKTKARALAGETFGSLIKPFMIRQQGLLKPRSLVETRRHSKSYATFAPDTDHGDRSSRHRSKTGGDRDEQRTVSGQRCKGSLGALFGWCIGQGLLETNPVSLVPTRRPSADHVPGCCRTASSH